LEAPPPAPSKSHVGGVIAVFLSLAVVIIIIIFALTNLSLFTNFFNLSSTETTLPVTNITGTNLTLSYPPNYDTLANYALSLINADRATFNVSGVTLSPIQSGQEHAYSMLVNGYFSHWDTQGYKPYMRYTLLNGTGAVEENVAFEASSLPSFVTTAQVETAISSLEHDMVYNDEACCQNGHLLNIINPYHNRVSIGIAYNSTAVYFVEDFENYYINLNAPIFVPSNQSVTLQGSTLTSLIPDSVIVSYDPTPTPINASTLNSQYQIPYNEGTFLGGAIPCASGLQLCNRFNGGITVRPSTWDVTNSSVDIVFSLQQFTNKDGSGVYTIYLTQNTFASNPNDTESLTSFSIFVQT
jgi:uncharacterized protein YkwD